MAYRSLKSRKRNLSYTMEEQCEPLPRKELKKGVGQSLNPEMRCLAIEGRSGEASIYRRGFQD
jgi:hypothetical protein